MYLYRKQTLSHEFHELTRMINFLFRELRAIRGKEIGRRLLPIE